MEAWEAGLGILAKLEDELRTRRQAAPAEAHGAADPERYPDLVESDRE